MPFAAARPAHNHAPILPRNRSCPSAACPACTSTPARGACSSRPSIAPPWPSVMPASGCMASSQTACACVMIKGCGLSSGRPPPRPAAASNYSTRVCSWRCGEAMRCRKVPGKPSNSPVMPRGLTLSASNYPFSPSRAGRSNRVTTSSSTWPQSTVGMPRSTRAPHRTGSNWSWVSRSMVSRTACCPFSCRRYVARPVAQPAGHGLA